MGKKAQETSPKTRKLTAKQQRFVEEYLVDLNAKQAAIRASYSAKTAEQQGYQLLQHPLVGEAIKTALAKRSERTEINADWLLKRLADEVEADVADLYDGNGSLLPVLSWPKVWRKGLVAGLETSIEYEEVNGVKRAAGSVNKIKLSDRLRRLELIGKHIAVGAFADKVEHTGKGGGPIETKDLGAEEIARRIAFALAAGMQAGKPA